MFWAHFLGHPQKHGSLGFGPRIRASARWTLGRSSHAAHTGRAHRLRVEVLQALGPPLCGASSNRSNRSRPNPRVPQRRGRGDRGGLLLAVFGPSKGPGGIKPPAVFLSFLPSWETGRQNTTPDKAALNPPQQPTSGANHQFSPSTATPDSRVTDEKGCLQSDAPQFINQGFLAHPTKSDLSDLAFTSSINSIGSALEIGLQNG